MLSHLIKYIILGFLTKNIWRRQPIISYDINVMFVHICWYLINDFTSVASRNQDSSFPPALDTLNQKFGNGEEPIFRK